MPETRETARLFGIAPGIDYPAALVAGLSDRLPDDPAVWARTTVFVSSGRMLRRLRAVFDSGPARLLPRMRLISQPAGEADSAHIPPALNPLELKLDLAQLLLSLIEREQITAPRAAAFDLAESLAALLDEMHGEGVGPEALAGLDVGGFAAHWQNGLTIVNAAFDHFLQRGGQLAGAEARRRQVVQALTDAWQTTPPPGPLVIAGSTGSRGATRMLMEAVARLPDGYVVLPGFDFDQPRAVWSRLDTANPREDHPQFRFRALMNALGLPPEAVRPWGTRDAATSDRNRLVSLALRPAPVTDQWRREGQRLTGLATATGEMTLLEAPDQRAEAAAIALRLRRAVADGQTAALISPDRMLTRRVTAALQRWEIEPDDSAGEPLHQTAPGRFLRQTADLLTEAPDLPALLALLKHPLTASTEGLRGPHLRWTREVELYLRRKGHARPTGAVLRDWAGREKVDDGRKGWAEWLAALLDNVVRGAESDLSAHVSRHVTLAEALAAGAGAAASGALWLERPGEVAKAAMQALEAAGESGGAFSARDYGNLLRGHLGGFSVLDPTRPHPGVMIWGTLEARVGGADLAILAGLNDGTWPDLPGPDTWLNRKMRQEAGLLSPERRIGLAAHDFQQAIAAPEVMLTRAKRDEDAETVPSRWLNRLVNLLDGLGSEGSDALKAMQARGAHWLALADEMECPAARVPAAIRPSPRPPVSSRPRQLSVTRITELIRDPYAIYARHILRLRKLDPLSPEPDARVRGMALHQIMERFLDVRDSWRDDVMAARHRLSTIARETLAEAIPQPSMQALWHARLMAAADRLVDGEMARLAKGEPVLVEDWGRLILPDLDFRLVARPDRIDRLSAGGYAIYDYKSGNPPTKDMVKHFDKQLPLEAAMLENDAFTGLSGEVSALGYVAIGASGQDRMLDLEDTDGRLPEVTLEGLRELIGRYATRAQGYTAIRAAQTMRFSGDYDHLARYGEWDLTDDPVPLIVGPEGAT